MGASYSEPESDTDSVLHQHIEAPHPVPPDNSSFSAAAQERLAGPHCQTLERIIFFLKSTEGLNRPEFCVGHFVKCNTITMCQTFGLDIPPLSASAKQSCLCVTDPKQKVSSGIFVNCSDMLTQSELEALK